MNLKKNLEGGDTMRRKGQSTLEYVIVLTAIIAGIIYAATNLLHPKVQSSIGHISDQMEAQVNKIQF